MRNIALSVLLGLHLFSCSPDPESRPLESALYSDPLLEKVSEHPDRYQVQIIYTRIDRDSANRPSFHTFKYKVDPNVYFYPASTVKFPAALLALEKMRNLGLDPSAPLLIDSAYSGQSPAYTDSTSENLLPSVAHYIKKILLVSDNDAFNRLYEFLGQQAFNDSLHAKGLTQTRITHRLSIALSEDENAHANPWRLMSGDSVVAQEGLRASAKAYRVDTIIGLGQGYMSDGNLINSPMDFAAKNFFPLEEQHRLLGSLIFPGEFPNEVPLHLTGEDYAFLYKYMSQLPSETKYPDYRDLPDHFVKYLVYGDGQIAVDSQVRIFNKIGQAYGFLTDNAYVADFKNGVEFLLSATIYVNEDGIFNDNVYEYDSIGFPFLGKLGRAILEQERQRSRAFMPDLSRFSVNYDR